VSDKPEDLTMGFLRAVGIFLLGVICGMLAFYWMSRGGSL
jgi:hypothetical protein